MCYTCTAILQNLQLNQFLLVKTVWDLHKVPSPRRLRRLFVLTDTDELALSFRIDEVVDTAEVPDSSSDEKFALDFLWIPLRNADTARLSIIHLIFIHAKFTQKRFVNKKKFIRIEIINFH